MEQAGPDGDDHDHDEENVEQVGHGELLSPTLSQTAVATPRLWSE
jgi:hypothetical protein